jgi:MFS family permease
MPVNPSPRIAIAASHAVGFFMLLGFGLGSPVLPLLADELGLTAASIGLAVGAFAIGRLLFGLGSLVGLNRAHHLLHPAWVVCGCVLTAAAAAWCALAPDATQLIVARAVQGVGSAMAMLAASVRPFVGDDRGALGRRVGDQQTVFLLGTAVGPVLGGVIGQFIGLHAPFWATALFALLGIPCGLIAHRFGESPSVMEPADRRAARASAGPGGALRGVGVLPVAIVVALVVVTIANANRSAFRTTLFPIWANDVLGMSETLIGVALSVGALGFLSFSLVGRLVDRLGSRPVVFTAGMLLAVATLLVLLHPAVWTAFVSMVLSTVGASSAIVASSTMLLNDGDRSRRLLAVRDQRVATDAGMFAGPVLIGLAIAAWSYSGAMLALSLAGLVVAAAALLLRPPTRIPQKETP